MVAPMRERRASISDEAVVQILTEGSERARAQAADKMKEVRKRVGIAL